MPFGIEFETNAGAIVTGATGAFVVAVTKKKLLTSVVLQVQGPSGYHVQVQSISGQTVNAQLFGGGAAGSFLQGVTVAVTIPAGNLNIWEVGS